MILPYTKMSGAGNTFILVEEGCIPEATDVAALAPTLCSDGQEHGGADGLIAVGPSDDADFTMRYYNRDGSTGMMCGNGGRCAVRFAVEHGYVDDESTVAFTNADVRYRAAITGRGVKVWFPDPRLFAYDVDIDVNGTRYTCHYADVGTPHAVMFVDEMTSGAPGHVRDVDVAKVGSAIRHHPRFAPDGANANFVEIAQSGSSIELRTFERGVEAETGACGTGAISSAIIAAVRRKLTPPIAVRTTSGETLWVDFSIDGDSVHDVSLEGSADLVSEGDFGLAW